MLRRGAVVDDSVWEEAHVRESAAHKILNLRRRPLMADADRRHRGVPGEYTGLVVARVVAAAIRTRRLIDRPVPAVRRGDIAHLGQASAA